VLGWCNMIHDAHAMTINGDYIKITKCSYVPTISNTLEITPTKVVVSIVVLIMLVMTFLVIFLVHIANIGMVK
jgi:hypothetical protein